MTGAREDHKHWSEVADEWIAWARKPNHDAFWAYRAALTAFIGPGHGRALDVGCGEGRISRELTNCGYQVTATDPVPRSPPPPRSVVPPATTLSPPQPHCHSQTRNSISSSPTTS